MPRPPLRPSSASPRWGAAIAGASVGWALACTPAPAPCPEASAAAFTVPADVAEFLAPRLAALEAGVQLVGEDAVGWTGPGNKRAGRDAVLEPGTWAFRATVDVPRHDRGWPQVAFEVSCVEVQPTPLGGVLQVPTVYDHAVPLAPEAAGPVTLGPFVLADSPRPDGPARCRWTLTLPRLRGVHEEQGTFIIPASAAGDGAANPSPEEALRPEAQPYADPAPLAPREGVVAPVLSPPPAAPPPP